MSTPEWILELAALEARKNGRLAQEAGAPLSDCPYPLGHRNRLNWRLGYLKSEEVKFHEENRKDG